MNIYEESFDLIQEKVDLGIITYEEAVLLNNLAYDAYISEGMKDNVKKIGHAVNDKLGEMGAKLVDGSHKRGEAVAKKIVKKPDANSHPSIVSQYNTKIQKVKTAYRVGEILTVNAAVGLLPGPGGIAFTTSVFSALSKSDHPDDKALFNKLKPFTDKVDNALDKIKGKLSANKGKMVTPELDDSIKKIEAEGLNAAKQADNIIRINDLQHRPGMDNKTPEKKNIAESVSIDLILDEYCNIRENAVDNLIDFMNNTETYCESTYDKIEELLTLI